MEVLNCDVSFAVQYIIVSGKIAMNPVTVTLVNIQKDIRQACDRTSDAVLSCISRVRYQLSYWDKAIITSTSSVGYFRLFIVATGCQSERRSKKTVSHYGEPFPKQARPRLGGSVVSVSDS